MFNLRVSSSLKDVSRGLHVPTGPAWKGEPGAAQKQGCPQEPVPCTRLPCHQNAAAPPTVTSAPAPQDGSRGRAADAWRGVAWGVAWRGVSWRCVTWGVAGRRGGGPPSLVRVPIGERGSPLAGYAEAASPCLPASSRAAVLAGVGGGCEVRTVGLLPRWGRSDQA